MATTINLRKILDRKQWEFCTPAPSPTAAGTFVTSSRHYRQLQFFLVNATSACVYLPEEDAWQELPSPALGGTFAAGACGACTSTGATGTATSGTSTTVSTNLDLRRDLRGFKIRITSGACAGDERTILSNTIGANATITVNNAFSSTINNTSVYQLLYTRWWVFNAHTTNPVANQFKYYDYALNTWTSLANLPAVGGAWGTDGRLIATPSLVDNVDIFYSSGTTTSATSNTLTMSAKNWATNQWANAYQLRITSGTGAGQIKPIASNTSATLTLASAFSPSIDSTSVFAIEGNDNYLYLIGNNAVTMYRYDIAAGTWTTLSPGVARAAAPGVGMSGHWVWGCNDTGWASENSILNGRRIYSFRGAGGGVIDYYDIPSNTWTNAIPYSPSATTFAVGTKYSIIDGRYIWIEKESTNRIYRFDPVKYEIDPGSQFLYPQGAAVAGDTCFDVTYTDGATKITWLYLLLNSSQVLLRMMVI